MIAAPGCKVGLGDPLLVPFAWLLLELQHMLQDGMAPSITSLPRSRAKLGSALCQETGLFLITKKKRPKFVSHLPAGWITNLTQMGSLFCFCGKLDTFSIPTRAA